MAKGRMLSKTVSTSKKLANLPTDSARLLWTWLLPHLDREGRFFAEPSVVKGHAVPRLKDHTEITIAEDLQILSDSGLIILYEVNGDRYLQYNQFDEHQVGLHKEREAPSSCPPPPVKVRRKSGGSPEKVPLNIIESNIKESNRVLESWNAQNVRNLKDGESKVREKTLAKIAAVLKEYPASVVIKSIENYGEVIQHPEVYFFSYKWELLEFLQRGLRKFMDDAKPFENFLKEKGGGRGSESPRVGANTKAPTPREKSIKDLIEKRRHELTAAAGQRILTAKSRGDKIALEAIESEIKQGVAEYSQTLMDGRTS